MASASDPGSNSASDEAGKIKEMILPWARYWVPQNGRILMGSNWDDSPGFLADPEDTLLGKHHNSHLRRTNELLAPTPGCLALCGEPGMGKSQTLRSHYDALPDVSRIRIEFRDVPDSGRFERMTVQSPAWIAWRQGTRMMTLVIDGIDEGLIKIPGFVDFLTGLLQAEPFERMQVVLACRSLEWPQSEGERLMGLWRNKGMTGVFELCPLRDRDARLAAETVLTGKGPRAVGNFIRAVRQHQLHGLATRPLTLKMLLHEYQNRGGFSKTHRELYRKFSHHLCLDPDEARRIRLKHQPSLSLQVTPAIRQRVAGRIAALLLVCGRSAIWTGAADKPATSDLTIDEICAADDRVGACDFNVTPTIVTAVLESPLFWPRESGRVGFYHQTFAESLAAEYLRHLPFPQKRSLLCQTDRHGEYVHPHLAELAAWMSADSDEFLQHLLTNDPETLLRSDVSALREASRASLVDAVLARAHDEQLFDARGLERFFHTLNHAGLAQQLRPFIRDRTRNHVVRRMAFAIAEACKLTELVDDVIACLRDPKDGMHSCAAASLDDMMDDASVPKLERFLKAKRVQTLAAGVQLSLLHALMEHGWTLTQALPFADGALQKRDLGGHILAQHAVADDAEGLLRGCLQWNGCFDRLSRYHSLVRKAHEFGLGRIKEPKIRRLMARVWWQAGRRYLQDGFLPPPQENGPSLMGELRANTVLRHQFIADMIDFPVKDEEERAWRITELTLAEDFPCFLERAQVGSARRRRVYAQLAVRTYNSELHAPLWDQLLAAIDQSSDIKQAFAWMRVWELDAPETKKARENYRLHIRRRQEAEAREKEKPRTDPVQVWTRDLDRLARGKPEYWLTLASNLFYRGGQGRADDEDTVDVRTSPGWKHHDETAQKKIVAGARRFLLEVKGNPHHPVGGNSEFDCWAYKAIYLLKDEIEGSKELREAVRGYWLPIIYDEFSNGDEHHLELIAIAYRLDGAKLRRMLKSEVLRQAKKDSGYTYALREFAQCWDRTLADFVVRFTVRDVMKPTTVGCVQQHLAEHDLPAALGLWRQLRADRAAGDRFVVATAALVSWRLFEVWGEVWPVLRANAQFAYDVFLRFDRSDQRKFLEKFGAGNEEHLADLYLSMRTFFPPEKDPPTPIGRSYSPTPRMEIARLRDEFPSLLAALGTDEAVEALLRVANAVPPKDRVWIRWRWREAIVACRRAAWRAPASETVLSLVRRANARLLVDESDLLALVLASLRRLDDNLTNQPNSWRRIFWKPERKGRNGARFYSPQDEVEMSRLITTWLQADLAPGRGVTIQREVQVQWDRRTDIEVRAVAVKGREARPLEIVVEVKGCWHTKVRRAHQDQLVDEYLQRSGKTHGIYLVVWTDCEKWNDPKDTRKVRLKAKTVAAARDELAELVSGHDGTSTPAVVRSMVLDARL